MSFIDQPGFADDVRSVLKDLLGLPQELMDYTVQYAALNPLAIPVSQLTGFAQSTAVVARVSGTTTTTGDVLYHDFGTPLSLTELVDGHYVFWFGASLVSVAADTQQGLISLGINGGATDTDAVQQQSAVGASLSGASIRTLSNKNNSTVKVQQRVTTLTYSISTTSPWIIGLKYANL